MWSANKCLSTKTLPLEFLRKKEPAILIKLQSISDIPFSKDYIDKGHEVCKV